MDPEVWPLMLLLDEEADTEPVPEELLMEEMPLLPVLQAHNGTTPVAPTMSVLGLEAGSQYLGAADGCNAGVRCATGTQNELHSQCCCVCMRCQWPLCCELWECTHTHKQQIGGRAAKQVGTRGLNCGRCTGRALQSAALTFVQCCSPQDRQCPSGQQPQPPSQRCSPQHRQSICDLQRQKIASDAGFSWGTPI